MWKETKSQLHLAAPQPPSPQFQVAFASRLEAHSVLSVSFPMVDLLVYQFSSVRLIFYIMVVNFDLMLKSWE